MHTTRTELKKIKVSDFIAKYLVEKHQVRHIFLIPGGGAMHLNDSFGNQKGLEYICNHHEQASSIAAEAYARVTGKLGLVNVTSGPGGLNTLTGVMGQWTDSVPVLYISGQIKQETSVYYQPDIQLRQLGDQEGDIIRVVKPITKFAETIRNPEDVKLLIDKAIHIALSGRKGPVWLDVPLDVQGAFVLESSLKEYNYDLKFENDSLLSEVDSFSSSSLSLNEANLDLLMDYISQAKRPIVVAGHGIRISGGYEEFHKFIDNYKIPIVTTFNGVDLLESNHPYYIGRIGTLGNRAGNFALQNSDLLISIGSRNNIRQVSYYWGSYARVAKKVVIDIDSNELKKHTLVPDLPIQMDAKLFLEGMNQEKRISKIKTTDFTWWHNWCSERKSKYSVVLPEHLAPKKPANIYSFIKALTENLADNSIVVAGNGSACVSLFQAAIVKKGQRYIWNSGCATMGYDLPGAIGASIATGRGPVVCVTGDGSIMMNLQELETINYLKLPIKIFLLNNQGYISMHQTQSAFFEGRLTAVDSDTGVGFPDFRKVANAFGFRIESIESNENIEETVEKILKIPGPIFCEVMLPKVYKFEPKLSSEKKPDGKLISKPLEDLSPLLSREEFKNNMLIPILNE